ncbi:L-2-hydroxyglutarate oxidase [Actinacidiphila bryophytorum]|uniref:L-2-hydroxyglutarate oxidase n=1 Tax=Actinacidiphila bryophytorum TaxID=1436133 RepID=UPI002176B382|nr:L-2-hydroxyglutarate oxidase [Actinacidiphila bryophytorum]UWE07731.1 L-2-hydroxyglutarate oxidase [Actinacidiphila bryophytorum]
MSAALEEAYDVLVVGAGIVGLSTAFALVRAEPAIRVAVVEKELAPGRHQTGRNSGVIHSGIYYRPGSLKARYALAGCAETPDFCAKHRIPYEVTGKLIVATAQAELPRLHALVQRGREHGIPVKELGPVQIASYEPEVAGLAAIHVGTTGICDFRAVAAALAGLAADAGCTIRYGLRVTAIDRDADGTVAVTADGVAEKPRLRTKVLVNCAGLHSDRIARLAGDDPGLRIVPFRGEFYELAPARRGLVRGLVYPVPDPDFPFLGVHLTRDVHGGVHLGPNAVPALAREGYGRWTVRPRDVAGTAAYPGTWRIARRHWRQEAGEVLRSLSKRAFTANARRLLPALRAADLRPAPAGVRAQAVLPDGTLVDDFRFAGSPPFVHVLNAPSPAATAALPIGREVARRVLAAL